MRFVIIISIGLIFTIFAAILSHWILSRRPDQYKAVRDKVVSTATEMVTAATERVSYIMTETVTAATEFFVQHTPLINKIPLATLVLLEGNIDGKLPIEIRIKREDMSFGRYRPSDVILSNPNISSLHFRIKLNSDGNLYILDEGSLNGTLINGIKAKVVENGNTLSNRDTIKGTILNDGDIIKIGVLKYQVKM